VWDRFKLRVPAGIGKVVLNVTTARYEDEADTRSPLSS